MIPARKESKGIINKNFLELGHKKVIEYTIEFALELLDVCDLVISTDNRNYLDSLSLMNLPGTPVDLSTVLNQKVMPRTIFLDYRVSELAQDNTPIIQVLQRILASFEIAHIDFHGILLLQPTSPFRSRNDLSFLRAFLSSEADKDSSLVSFKRVGDQHPARMYKQLNSNTFVGANFFPGMEQVRRQELPSLFIRDGGFYFIGKNLISKGQQFSNSPKGLIRDFPWSINLDTMTDLMVAQSVISDGNYFKEKE